MAFTPLAVHENATPDANEVLVSGLDADGIQKNVLLRSAPDLRAQLIATPAAIANPSHAAVSADLASATAFASDLAEQLADMPDDDSGRAALATRANAARETMTRLTAQLGATAPTLPNPDRAPIERQAFDAAVAQVVADATPPSESNGGSAEA